jgi:hypothetical protein
MQHVLCRKQCVLPDFTGIKFCFVLLLWFNCTPGARLAPFCDLNFTYLELIDECIPISIASTNLFLSAYQTTKACQGGSVDSTAALERLRYCQVISGGLHLSVNDLAADFSSLHDIQQIEGLLASVDLSFNVL